MVHELAIDVKVILQLNSRDGRQRKRALESIRRRGECLPGTSMTIRGRERLAASIIAHARRKIRRLVDANIVGIFIWDLDGTISTLVGAAASKARTKVWPSCSTCRPERAEAAQTRAQAELQQARTALAHRQRVSLLGEVAASLAPKSRSRSPPPISTKVCRRALADDRLNLEAAREAASRLDQEATWADEIIQRTTALDRKDTTHRERVDVNTLIRDGAAAAAGSQRGLDFHSDHARRTLRTSWRIASSCSRF